jgi:hypothetical protein
MTRRQVWLLSAVALLTALLAGGVFFASLNEEKKRRSLNGPGPFPGSLEDRERTLREIEALRKLNKEGKIPPAGVDPRIQEALQTVQEINRINQVNQQNRQRLEKPILPPPPTAKPVKKSE